MGKHDFSWALIALKEGKRIARAGWNGKGMWLVLCEFDNRNRVPDSKDENKSYEKLPWIGMKTADDKFVPWLASQSDCLAEDWEIVE